MTYHIRYTDGAMNDIKHLPPSVKPSILKAINTRLALAPAQYGKPLQHNLSGYRRLRSGDWRIIYRVQQETHTVLIAAIDHRKDVYDPFH